MGTGEGSSSGSGTEYALHPSMKAMHDIYENGQLAVVPGVHYPFANYSHFASEVIYYTGNPATASGSGWMGKYFDLAGFTGTDVPAVMMGNNYNPLFTPSGTSLFAFNNLRELRYPAGSRRVQRSATFQDMCAESGASDPAFFPELSAIGNTAVAAIGKFEQYYKTGDDQHGKVEKLFINENGEYQPYFPLVYDTPLNNQGPFGDLYLTNDMRHIAATIRSDVGARFFHVGIGGFDTHSNQEQGFYHSFLLNQVSEAIGNLWADLSSTVTLPAGYEGDGYLTGDLSSRVIIVTLSEFGRTNKQNAAGANAAGTDHGQSAPQFVIGSTVQAGMHGTYPSLQDVEDNNDTPMAFDYRDFYGTILERWLNVPISDIGPGVGKLFATSPIPDGYGNDYLAYTPIPFLLP